MDSKTREELRVQIAKHYGAQTEVAKRAEVSHSYVQMVLKGQRTSKKVLTIACEVLLHFEKEAAAHEKAQAGLFAQINGLLSAQA